MKGSSKAASKCFIMLHIHVFLVPCWVSATWRNLTQTSIRVEFLSENLPVTRGLRRISQFSRSITLLLRAHVQCSGKSQWVSISSMPFSTVLAAVFNFITFSSTTTAFACSREAFLFSSPMVEGEMPYSTSVMSFTWRTETLARGISMSVSSVQLSRWRYRLVMAPSKDAP